MANIPDARNSADDSSNGEAKVDKNDPHKTEKLTQHGREDAEKADGDEVAEGGDNAD